MSTANLDNTTLSFTSDGSTVNAEIVASASSMNFNGVGVADVALTGIGNLAASGDIITIQTVRGTTFHGSNFTNTQVPYTSTGAGALATNSGLTYDDGSNTLDADALDINGESIAGVRVFYGYSTDTTAISTTATNVAATNGYTQVVADTGYTESTNGVITVTDAGLYEISFCLVTLSDGVTGANRAQIIGEIELDTGGGFSAVTGSTTISYLREQAANITGYALSKTIVISLSANDDVQFVFYRVGTTTCALSTNSTMLIKRLRP